MLTTSCSNKMKRYENAYYWINQFYDDSEMSKYDTLNLIIYDSVYDYDLNKEKHIFSNYTFEPSKIYKIQSSALRNNIPKNKYSNCLLDSSNNVELLLFSKIYSKDSLRAQLISSKNFYCSDIYFGYQMNFKIKFNGNKVKRIDIEEITHN